MDSKIMVELKILNAILSRKQQTIRNEAAARQ